MEMSLTMMSMCYMVQATLTVLKILVMDINNNEENNHHVVTGADGAQAGWILRGRWQRQWAMFFSVDSGQCLPFAGLDMDNDLWKWWRFVCTTRYTDR